MKLSFVIPVFKTERYLARCLDSLAAQTDGDFEAIVVDDASPGNGEVNPAGSSGPPCQAEEIVRRYDARFKCVRQDRNRSTFQAKATGAKLATGDYVVPLDSDDYVLPRLVEELKRGATSGDAVSHRVNKGEIAHLLTRRDSASPDALQSNNPTIQQSDNSPDLIVYQMSKEFRGKVYPVKYNHPVGRCTGAEALEKLFAGRLFMPVCGKAIRREVFLRAYEGLGVGPDFYLNFTDDLCWLIPILLNTKTVTFIDYPGYRYWRHEDSMTKDVMAPEKVRQLAEQSRRSVDAAVSYAERLGAGSQTVAQIRAQIYPTIRWLLRDRSQPRALLEEAYGADLVAETLRWDAASGGKTAKLLRHLRTYGLAATIREVCAQLRHEEI